MIITIPWLKEHLKTSAKESEIIDQLTNIGLEVESIKENSGEMGRFRIAKILKVEKHPNADKLKVCDISIGKKEIFKVVSRFPVEFFLGIFHFYTFGNSAGNILGKAVKLPTSFGVSIGSATNSRIGWSPGRPDLVSIAYMIT